MISLGKKASKKRVRKRIKASVREKRQSKHHAKLATILPFSWALALIVGVFFILQLTLFSSNKNIKDILYAPESVGIYDDPYLYKTITDEIIGRNIYLMKWYALDDILLLVQEDFPIVRSINVESSDRQRVYITIDFYKPTLVFQTPDTYVAAYNNQLFPLVSGNTLWQDVLTVQLPRYTSWATSLHGVLYMMHETELKEKITTILETLGASYISELIYLPGGMKLFINYKGKKVYFHLDQEINRQLAKLIDLENYFQDFSTTSTIDLWSIEDIIVR